MGAFFFLLVGVGNRSVFLETSTVFVCVSRSLVVFVFLERCRRVVYYVVRSRDS